MNSTPGQIAVGVFHCVQLIQVSPGAHLISGKGDLLTIHARDQADHAVSVAFGWDDAYLVVFPDESTMIF